LFQAFQKIIKSKQLLYDRKQTIWLVCKL